MLSMNPREIALIFGELVQCLYNKNGFGGRTAEIYAYRCAQATAFASSLSESHLDKETLIRSNHDKCRIFSEYR